MLTLTFFLTSASNAAHLTFLDLDTAGYGLPFTLF